MKNKDKNILLIQPKATNYGGFRAPLNLLQLATSLKQKNYKVTILDLHTENPSIHQLRELHEEPMFVGISAFTGLQSSEAIRIARLIKSIKPDIPIVWGGYHVSLWKELALKSDLVDYIVTGPGENEICKIADSIFEDNSPNERIFHGHHDFEIPSPSYELIDLSKYITRTLLAKRVANVNTSYGCPHACSFCAVSDVFERKWIAKPHAQVLDEVEYLVKNHAIKGLEFSDNAPFIDKNRMLSIAEGFLGKNFEIAWMSMARVDELNSLMEDELKLLVRSGFKRVFVGIESGDNKVLNKISKNQKIDEYLMFAENCVRFGIVPDYSFTLGYPPDPSNDIKQSLKLAQNLKRITPQGIIMFYWYTPYSQRSQDTYIMKFPDKWEGWGVAPWNLYSLTSAQHPWLKIRHTRLVRDFITVMTCAFFKDERIFPQHGRMSALLDLMIPLAKFRWEKGFFSYPWDIRILLAAFRYLNPQRLNQNIAT